MTELAIGNYLTLRIPPPTTPIPPSPYFEDSVVVGSDGYAELRFQNFWIGQNAIWQGEGTPKSHTFAPFGFSGMTASRSGDNGDSTLIFPNTPTSRSFADRAVREKWQAVVRVCLIDNLENPEQSPQQLYQYTGQVVGGTWITEQLSLKLNSVLDAVSSQIPRRTLLQTHVGYLPFSGNLSL